MNYNDLTTDQLLKNKIMKYRKKPIVIEAIQFNNINREEIEAFVGEKLHWELESETAYLAGVAPPISSITIPTKEGNMKAFPGDYVIREPFPTGDRDFYPCKPDIFEKTYERVEDSPIIGGDGLVSTKEI